MTKPTKLEVYVDGSGPGPDSTTGGWAVIHVKGGNVVEERAGFEHGTDATLMEMQAVIKALDGLDANAEATVYTDAENVLGLLKLTRNSKLNGRTTTASHKLARTLAKSADARPGCELKHLPRRRDGRARGTPRPTTPPTRRASRGRQAPRRRQSQHQSPRRRRRRNPRRRPRPTGPT